MPRSRILGFDGLRALAFLLVFISHKVNLGVTERYGTAGVWLFFVLSGFLITRILYRQRSDIEAGSSDAVSELKTFYLRRTLRIFPVYYVFLTVITIVSSRGLLDLGDAWRQLSYWLYLGNVYIEFHDWGPVGHLWSLAVEEQFYLFFAPLALLLPLKRLPLTCAGLILVSAATHVLLFAVNAGDNHLDANSLVNFGLLGLGGLAGLAADRPLPAILRSNAAIGCSLLAYVVLPLLTSKHEWLLVGRLSGVIVALLLIQVHQSQESRAVAVLNWRPLQALGVVSYGAYLFHPVIKFGALLATAGLEGMAAYILGVVFDFGATVLLAALSWRYFEAPVRNLAGRAKTSVPQAASLS